MPVIEALTEEEWDGDPDTVDGSKVHVRDMATAVQIWSWGQGRETTVAEAALAFNVRPELISQAVDYCYYLYERAGVIEHEGL